MARTCCVGVSALPDTAGYDSLIPNPELRSAVLRAEPECRRSRPAEQPIRPGQLHACVRAASQPSANAAKPHTIPTPASSLPELSFDLSACPCVIFSSPRDASRGGHAEAPYTEFLTDPDDTSGLDGCGRSKAASQARAHKAKRSGTSTRFARRGSARGGRRWCRSVTARPDRGAVIEVVGPTNGSGDLRPTDQAARISGHRERFRPRRTRPHRPNSPHQPHPAQWRDTLRTPGAVPGSYAGTAYQPGIGADAVV